MKRFATATLATLCLSLVSAVAQAQTDPALAAEAYAILQEKCYNCHGGQNNFFDVSIRESLVPTYVVAQNLKESKLWQMIGEQKVMPPQGSPQLEETELGTLKRWIESGADFPPPAKPRVPRDERYILKQIDLHLSGVNRDNWKHQRYFSLAHLHNNEKVTDYQLRLYRAALSKVINSLHRKGSIILPLPVDPDQVVFNLDLRAVGWLDPTQFLQVLQEYPFALEHNDSEINNLAENVNERLGGGNRLRNRVPYVRADWFVAKASRPPLYNTLLALPDTEAKLQTELGVQFTQEFNNDTLLRAAFTESGVSRRNRLVDRLEGNIGYYYRSDDFGGAAGRSVIPRFPLGPRNAFPQGQHPFDAEAYVPDGGEVVFRLPNGMQGYLIVDANGNRINEAPVNVVRDLTEISGSPLVVNGISCMGCHKEGVREYRDNIRRTVTLGGNARSKINALYRESEVAEKIQEDSGKFMESLNKCIGPFLKQAEHAKKDIRYFPEPIVKVVKLYDSGVSLEDAARELGVDKAALQASLKTSAIQALGLGPLGIKDEKGRENKIPRDVWDSKDDNGTSVFQVVAREMNIGIGVNIPKN